MTSTAEPIFFRSPLLPAALALVCIFSCTSCRAQAQLQTAAVKRVAAWVIGGSPSITSLEENIDAIDVVSPAFYRVGFTASGPRIGEWDPGNPVDRNAIGALVRRYRVPMVPLIACMEKCAQQMSAVLRDPEKRAAHVSAIIDAIKGTQVDGIFVDYEGLSCPAKDFTAFIEQLSGLLRERKLKLGVAVTEPCGLDPNCSRPVYPFDLGRLAELSDYLAIMEYDYSVDGSDAVAPRPWLVKGLTRVRELVKERRAKVFVGVPFYGRLTKGLARDTGVLWSEIQDGRIQGKRVKIVTRTFDSVKLSQVASVRYGADSRPGTLHFQDHTTLGTRLQVIGSNGFSNIAVWRLGGEDPCNWDAIRSWRMGTLSRGVYCRAQIRRRALRRNAARRRQVVAWMIGGRNGLASLRKNLDVIDVVSPAYYRVAVNAKGGTSLGDWDPGNPVLRRTVRALTRKAKVALVPLVACSGTCAARASGLLADPVQRAAHVDAILKGVEPDGVDGIFIDYQGLTSTAAQFNAFVDLLSRRLSARGQRLGVAVAEPCGIAPECERPGYQFDLGHLARTADYLAVLEYDYSVDGSESVAPKQWLLRGLDRLTRDVGTHRASIFVGVPFYGRISRSLTSNTAVLWAEVDQGRIQKQSFKVVNLRFDPEKLSQVADIRFGKKRKAGKIYYEDHATVASRLTAIAKRGFSNLAVWRLGGEDPCNWDVIRAWKKKRLRPGFTCPLR